TPLGFEYATADGGINVERALTNSPNVYFGLSLSRRAVTDSLTSFAGTRIARDVSSFTAAGIAREDMSWGGVTANGGRLQLGYDDADVGLYGYGSLHRLIGHNTKSNTRVELGGGAY